MKRTLEQELRDTLRRGDPAGGPGLSPEEILSMRRAVLTAVPEPRRRLLWIPALATGLAALALALGLWLRQAPQPPAPPQVAAVASPTPPAPVSVEPVVTAPAPPSRAPEPAVQPPPVRRARRASPPPLPPAEEPQIVLAQAEPESRQIQFSTPGGTRVIWVLSPDSAL